MKPSRTRSFSTTTPMSEDAAVLVVNMDVEYTGPDGVTRTETFEHHQGRVIVPGRRVQIRVWPDERRAELDDGDKHTGPIVYGGILTLLGAGATVLLVLWHHGMRFEKCRARFEKWWSWSWWWLSRWQ